MTIAARLAEVQAAIAAAALRAGRDPQAVQLIAVSKTQPLEAVNEAYDAGARDFGENIAQELQRKAVDLAASGRREARWHFIGRLQRNKVGSVVDHAHRIHSVDRPELVVALARRLGEAALPILLQVNIGREPQKGGVDPGALLDLARQVSQHANLHLQGLMAVPPAEAAPAPYFLELAQLLDGLRREAGSGVGAELSMGMSHDFETAIACGATWVRVGTAIFGVR